jgi:hypothetical protein
LAGIVPENCRTPARTVTVWFAAVWLTATVTSELSGLTKGYAWTVGAAAASAGGVNTVRGQWISVPEP